MLQCVQGNREANDNQQIVCGKKLGKQRDLWLPHQLRCAYATVVVCCCYCCITQHFCVCLALFGYSCNYFQLRFYVSVLLLFSCPPTLAHCCAQLLLFITTCHKVERYYATFCYCSSLQSFAINNNNNNVLAITTAITHSVMRNARRFHLRSEEKLLIAGTSKRQHPHTHIHIHICEHIKNLLHFSRFTRT